MSSHCVLFKNKIQATSAVYENAATLTLRKCLEICLEILRNVSPLMCRTCLRNITILSFPQYENKSLMAVCIYLSTLQTGGRKNWFSEAFMEHSCYFLFFVVVFYILNQVSSCFSCLAECCNTVLQWSSRNVLWTMNLHLTFPQQEGEEIMSLTCRTCLRNITFLGFLQYYSNPVMTVWICMNTLQTGGANS